jgi:hypothetical protein
MKQGTQPSSPSRCILSKQIWPISRQSTRDPPTGHSVHVLHATGHHLSLLHINRLQPAKEICATHEVFYFATLANLNTGTMYTNLPGTFPVHSFKSMQYLFVEYIDDLNAILVCTMPSKNDAAMIATFTNILAALAACGYMPTLNVTYNECSKMVEAYIKSNKINIHLVPPTTTASMPPNMPLPHSRNTSSRGCLRLTGTTPSNCGTNFTTT